MRERCRSATVRPDIRLLRTVLESNDGFAVLGEAADGAETVRLVAELRPDVVVLDLAMPVMDGLQALAEIRRRSPATKVVVFSGYGEDQAAARLSSWAPPPTWRRAGRSAR